MRQRRALLLAGVLVIVMTPVATSCGTDEDASTPTVPPTTAITVPPTTAITVPPTTTAATVSAHDHAEGMGSSDEMAHGHGSHDHGATTTGIVSGGEDWATPDGSFSVAISEGTVVGGIPRLEASIGDLILITVTSDISDEVHLHVYDLTVLVGPGEPAVFNIEATIPGIFEAELHDAGFRVFELEVS
jgi:hypothetical protein